MKTLLLVGLGVCALLQADTYPRQPGVDVQHYVFRVTLSDDTDQIAGETTVTVRFVQPGVTQFALDLAGGMTVAEVNTPFRREAERLVIPLPAAPAAGE